MYFVLIAWSSLDILVRVMSVVDVKLVSAIVLDVVMNEADEAVLVMPVEDVLSVCKSRRDNVLAEEVFVMPKLEIVSVFIAVPEVVEVDASDDKVVLEMSVIVCVLVSVRPFEAVGTAVVRSAAVDDDIAVDDACAAAVNEGGDEPTRKSFYLILNRP